MTWTHSETCVPVTPRYWVASRSSIADTQNHELPDRLADVQALYQEHFGIPALKAAQGWA